MSAPSNRTQAGLANRVVVGTDGSQAAQDAVLWAAQWAESLGLPLTVLAALMTRYASASDAPMTSELAEAEADQSLSEAVAAVRKLHPALDVSTLRSSMRPGTALVQASEEAALVVVGTRGKGGVAGTTIGSVAAEVATYAHGPVAVIPANHPWSDDRPIILAFDWGGTTNTTIRYAFGMARRARKPLTVLYAFSWVRYENDQPVRNDSFSRALGDPKADIEEELGVIAADYPGVDWKLEISPESPEVTLQERSATSSALVMGSRGMGGFRGLLLGSTSRRTIRYSKCPVFIIPNSLREDRLQ